MNKQPEATINTERIEKILDPRNIQKGIIIFVLITLAAFTGLFLYSNTGETLRALRELKLEFIFLSLIMAFFDWWIGGWRNHIFFKQLYEKFHWRHCFDANLANIFVGAVTPSQTGGGPAQWYLLYRRGVKLTDNLAVSIINYVSTIFFFVISGGIAIYYIEDIISNQLIQNLIRSAFFFFITGLILIILSLVIPKQMGKVVVKIAEKLNFLWKKGKSSLIDKAKDLAEHILSYHETMMLFVRKKPILFPISFVITCLLYFNKYCIAYVLLLGLGIEADFWLVIMIQAVIFFILYFAPSPGGSGIAEISIAALMAQIVVDNKLATFTMLHRCFLLIIPAIIGAIILLKELRKQSKGI